MFHSTFSDATIAWFAGVFEGEGCMSIAKNGGTRLTIGMTDLDIIQRIDAMFPCTRIYVKTPPLTPAGTQPKTQYIWRMSDPGTVKTILELLLPWLGKRRAARAREVLEHLETRRSSQLMTHCRNGHEMTPENSLKRVDSKSYRCRICSNASQRRYQAKKKLKEQLRGQAISA